MPSAPRRTITGQPLLACLAVALVTGGLLALRYDPRAPLESLASLELASTAGRVTRALHAWSSHLGLTLIVVHLVERAVRPALRREGLQPRSRWLSPVALLVLLGLLFAAAVSGFCLRGDVEGEATRNTLRLLGGASDFRGLTALLLGGAASLRTLLVHHALTLSLPIALLALVTIAARDRSWGTRPASSLIAPVLVVLVGAYLAPPALHDGVDPCVTGPWYLQPLQARLRGAPLCNAAWASATPRPRLSPMALASLPLDDTRLDRLPREGCIGCHGAASGLTGAHAPRAIGCASCHLGDPHRPDAAGAHRGMLRVPGNLDSIWLSCGSGACHALIASRVVGALMNTGRGLVAVDRFAFGEQATPDGSTTLDQLGGSHADTHLGQLCASCHLGRPKVAPAPISELSRGGGCVACHLLDSSPRSPAGAAPVDRFDPARFTHPGLTLRIGDGACFGCHSRSGRIALNYAGWREIAEPAAGTAVARRLDDGRPLARADADDVHHARGLACIDCHTARETMGDGASHAHEELATTVRCTTCHRARTGTRVAARTVARAALDEEAAAIVRLRDGDRALAELLIEDGSGEALTNARPIREGADSGAVEIRGKLDSRSHLARPPSPECSAITGHERLSCQSCHSAWAPRCVGCHTQRSTDGGGDRAPDEEWVEYEVAPEAAPPALGLLDRRGITSIEPFVPGMILTLNTEAPGAHRLEKQAAPLPRSAAELINPRTRFLRAWAFAAPHTTTRAGRSCRSCHLDPAALGWGRGNLSLVEERGHTRWRFVPAHSASRFDGLPDDAWTGFLADPRGAVATRTYARPIELATARRALAVGACMSCHDPAAPAGRALFRDYAGSRARRRPQCRVPDDEVAK